MEIFIGDVTSSAHINKQTLFSGTVRFSELFIFLNILINRKFRKLL